MDRHRGALSLTNAHMLLLAEIKAVCIDPTEMCKAPCQSSTLTRDDRAEELSSDRTRTDLPAQVKARYNHLQEPFQDENSTASMLNVV